MRGACHAVARGVQSPDTPRMPGPPGNQHRGLTHGAAGKRAATVRKDSFWSDLASSHHGGFCVPSAECGHAELFDDCAAPTCGRYASTSGVWCATCYFTEDFVQICHLRRLRRPNQQLELVTLLHLSQRARASRAGASSQLDR